MQRQKKADSEQILIRYLIGIPMLCEHIDCRGVVGAVAVVKSPHLGHEVKEEASHPLLVLW